MAVFEFDSSEPFLVEMFQRYRRTRRLRLLGIAVKFIAGLCLTALIVVCVLAHAFGAVVALVPILALLVFSRRVDDWRLKHQFRKSPFHNAHVRIELDESGLKGYSETGQTHLSWAAFTAARRFSDGFLLFHGPHVFRWLPIRSLTVGSVAEVDRFLRAGIPHYTGA